MANCSVWIALIDKNLSQADVIFNVSGLQSHGLFKMLGGTRKIVRLCVSVSQLSMNRGVVRYEGQKVPQVLAGSIRLILIRKCSRQLPMQTDRLVSQFGQNRVSARHRRHGLGMVDRNHQRLLPFFGGRIDQRRDML